MLKKIIFILLGIALIYTRFINLDWGKPYPFHPDENNMVRAIEQLNCRIQLSDFKTQGLKNCLNPNFFAYGQPPLYFAYAVSKVSRSIEPRIALRLISALSSIANALILLKILAIVFKDERKKLLKLSLLIITFSPYFIQFSHFGTTESFLMLLYSLIILFSLKMVSNDRFRVSNLLLLSIISGLAIATKLSALAFIAVPIITLLVRNYKNLRKFLFFNSLFLLLAIFFVFVFSPHNAISFKDFLGTMEYETAVGRGLTKVFYTRQFEFSIPILFQFTKIFPYTLGWPVLVMALVGFFGLSWKDIKINVLRVAFITFLLPSAFLYAKWTRFISPILPIFTLFAILLLEKMWFAIQNSKHSIRTIRYLIPNTLYLILICITLLPGIAYISVYRTPDVRVQASEWMHKNIPDGSYILSETANVVDIPVYIPNPSLKPLSYSVASFDFYGLDENPSLVPLLENHIEQADYIVIPSRRIFADHTCEWPDEGIKQKVLGIRYKVLGIRYFANVLNGYTPIRCERLQSLYPQTYEYYRKLFSKELGFEKVAEFSSYPKIELFGWKFLEFPDEKAEETWTVFDHPVIRVYKRMEKKY